MMGDVVLNERLRMGRANVGANRGADVGTRSSRMERKSALLMVMEQLAPLWC